MIAPDAAEMSTVLASSMPRYPLRMLRPTRPTSARMAQIRSMFPPLSGQPPDPVDGRVRRLRVRAVVRGVGVHGPARVGGVRVDAPGARGGRVQARAHGAARVRGPGELPGPAPGGLGGPVAEDPARGVRDPVRPGADRADGQVRCLPALGGDERRRTSTYPT